MCGIVGFSGAENAVPMLIEGLKRLEYRGYDSAGIAAFTKGSIGVVKCKGRIAGLEEKINEAGGIDTVCGVGHTRWATHGEPSDVNSHPHLGPDGRIAVVHNGIIENYLEIKDLLAARGVNFLSETDTEVIACLLEYYYDGDILATVRRAVNRLRGSYALGILCADNPGVIIAARKDCPLIVGLSKKGNFIASDLPAILKHTRDYISLEDGETAVVAADGVTIFDPDGMPVVREPQTAVWDIEAAEKGGYEHFMIKEIMEQPSAVKKTLSPSIKDGLPSPDGLRLTDADFASAGKIVMAACGSAYHAGIVGKNAIERLGGIPCEAWLASEFRYAEPITNPGDIFLVISQSGETADSLAALREAKRRGMHVIGIVNVNGSSIARESDSVFLTQAGPEIAVATTKAYSAQLAALFLLAVKIGMARGRVDEARARELCHSLMELPEKIENMLESREEMQYIASRLANHEHVFFIGRGTDYSAGLEASLKLKEISYIHSEAYAAGELKHGTISLITPGSLVVALATQDKLYEKMLSNVKEVKARGATIMAVSGEGFSTRDAEYTVSVPEVDPLFSPLLSVVPMQLFAYFVSVNRGCDVDKPRNLAKSVTVE